METKTLDETKEVSSLRGRDPTTIGPSSLLRTHTDPPPTHEHTHTRVDTCTRTRTHIPYIVSVLTKTKIWDEWKKEEGMDECGT